MYLFKILSLSLHRHKSYYILLYYGCFVYDNFIKKTKEKEMKALEIGNNSNSTANKYRTNFFLRREIHGNRYIKRCPK